MFFFFFLSFLLTSYIDDINDSKTSLSNNRDDNDGILNVFVS